MRKDGDQSGFCQGQPVWEMFRIQRKKPASREADWKETEWAKGWVVGVVLEIKICTNS